MLDFILLLIFFIFSLVCFYRIINFYDLKSNIIYNKINCKSISIIIPVRNEKERIKSLLQSLNQIEKNNIEIIIVDDNSFDEIETFQNLNKLKILKVKDYYQDLEGKSIACYLGALNSSNDYLLFLDADVFFEKEGFDYILNNIPEDGILTILPYHKMEKFYEQFSLFSNLIIFLGLELGKLKSKFLTNKGYFGPFFLIKKKDYFKVGGHNRVKDSIIEDMDLGQILANSGYKIYSIPHNKLIKFRMYSDGFLKLFNGWTKNMVKGASKSSLFTILIISSLIICSLSIPINLIKSIYKFDISFIIIYVIFYILYAFMIYFISKKIGEYKLISALLFPIFSIFFVIIFIRSIIFKIFKLEIDWRGNKVKIS